MTLHETVSLAIIAEDDDNVTFHVINKPAGATRHQSGNVLHFTWPVTSTQKVGCISNFLLKAIIVNVFNAININIINNRINNKILDFDFVVPA